MNDCIVATRPRTRVTVALDYFDYLAQTTETAEEIRIEDRDVPLAHRQVALIIASNEVWRLVVRFGTQKFSYNL